MSVVLDQKWYVLYTKPRSEALVEADLQKRGFESYVPSMTLKRKWSDRIKEIQEPLFKSYCFAKFDLLQDKFRVLSLSGVVHIVNFDYQYVPVEEETINSLKILIDNELKIDPFPYLTEGREITIKKGHLKGFKGFIEEKRNKNMSLVVSVDAIGASVRCVIDSDSVDIV